MPEPKRKEGESSGSKLRKFDPRTKKGIFMGYHVPPGGRWKGDYRVLDFEICEKAESSNDVTPFRVKEIFPESQLTFPVKDGTVKTAVPGILEEVREHEEGYTGSSEDMLAQTPHDIVVREPTHDAGGAANSEQVPEVQEQGQVAPTTKDEWVIRGANPSHTTIPHVFTISMP